MTKVVITDLPNAESTSPNQEASEHTQNSPQENCGHQRCENQCDDCPLWLALKHKTKGQTNAK
jgi:hypothetical protein